MLDFRTKMTDLTPIILWFRRDLRLADHPALTAACASGRPVIPVFIHDDTIETLGAAAKFRLGRGVEVFASALAGQGSRLILRRGKALDVVKSLVAETGAGAVFWSRAYEPAGQARDAAVKAALRAGGVEARSFAGHLLHEPWTVQTGTGGFYKVFTPFWNAVRGRDVPGLLPAPPRIMAPAVWPVSDAVSDWTMAAAMRRGAAVLAPHLVVGEAAARDRLERFIAVRVADYRAARDLPGVDGTSGLSENLTYGEISPLTCWHTGMRAMQDGKAGAETFLKELVWREFAYHLTHHSPHILTQNWKPDWDTFPWNTNALSPDVKAWQQGRTGVPFVDAALRQMYVTGVMHNRGRMIVASYLTKHLMTHWKIGLEWFADCLIDWDPASNAMGWQWAAGSGPDAAPYFRIFNPVSQLEKFDPRGIYAKTWIAEGQRNPPATALSYFDAIPHNWKLSHADPYAAPIVDLAQGRTRALQAYADRVL
jgi:deoxyribodipyrimidine photo-lyase